MDVHQFIRGWMPEDKGEQDQYQVVESDDIEESQEEESPAEERPTDMEELDDIIKKKHCQLLLKIISTSGLIKCIPISMGKAKVQPSSCSQGLRMNRFIGH